MPNRWKWSSRTPRRTEAGALALLAFLSAPALADEVADQPQAPQVYAEAVQALRAQDCERASDLLRRYLEMAPATLAKHPNLQDKISHQIALCAASDCDGRGGELVIRGEKSVCNY